MEALDILSCQPESLSFPGMETALEVALGAESTASGNDRSQRLIQILQELSRLSWGSKRLQQELWRRWQHSRLADLTATQLQQCYQTLKQL